MFEVSFAKFKDSISVFNSQKSIVVLKMNCSIVFQLSIQSFTFKYQLNRNIVFISNVHVRKYKFMKRVMISNDRI